MADIVVVTKPTRDALSERQTIDYRAYKEEFIRWLSSVGKDPQHADGYAEATVEQTSTRIDKFYVWLWEQNGRYTTTVSPEDATAYMNRLVCSEEDYSNNHLSNTQKSIKRLFKWLQHARGFTDEWDSPFSFSSASTNPRDYLTIEERRKIREAALEYGSIPAYNGLSPEERDKWKAHLAQRFDKPKSSVSKADWKRANGWKMPSLVWTSLDAGLRPIEVERATVQWVDIENRVLRIPKEESSKNQDNWIVSLTDRTADALSRWLAERELYERYEGRNELWLTRELNPYRSNSLARIIKELCKIADIPIENRKMSWYTIRHSLGTYMTRHEDLAATQAQLRHKSILTTTKYDQVPVDDRRNALNKMG